MKLTPTTIRTLTLPPGLAEKTFFDDDVAGFGVRIRAGGSRNYILQYKLGVRHRRVVLGAVVALDLGKARATAKDLLAKVRLGQDPAGDRIKQRAKMAETFAALLPRYLERQRLRLKPRSFKEVERHLKKHARPLHPHPIDGIDRRTIALLLQKIAERSGPGATNSVRTSLSGYFVWIAREGFIETNPVAFTVEAITNGPRTRALTDDELTRIWQSAGDGHYGAIVRLLIATGARRDEIAWLGWSEVDLDAALIMLPGGQDGRTKNRREHEIPLNPLALEILRAQSRRTEPDGSARDLIFGHRKNGYQNWSRSKQELDARAGVHDWTLHDFRRAMSTAMHERLGILPHIVEMTLAHVGGHKGGVAGTYNLARYRDQKRIALDKWGELLACLIDRKPSARVVKLRRG